MLNRLIVTLCLTFAVYFGDAVAQVEVNIKNGDSPIPAMAMGEGDHVVIALHGRVQGDGRRYFFHERGGKIGQELAGAGFRVIAPTWAGQSGAGFGEVAAAIAFAKETGAKKISLMGHSAGGALAANYARQQPDGIFDTVIQFSSADDKGLPMTKTKKLFAFNKNDRLASWQAAAFEKSAEPKQMVELGGSGHLVSELISEKPDLAKDVVTLLKK